MVRDQLHKLVDDLFELRQSVVGDRIPAAARRHFLAARKEALLGVRSVVDHALSRVAAAEEQATRDSQPRKVPVEE